MEAVYERNFLPIDFNNLPESNEFDLICLPPSFSKTRGRPRTARLQPGVRRRRPEEDNVFPACCSHCHSAEHNRRICPELIQMELPAENQIKDD